MAFMPRHGDEHELPPHRINYRANVWAMREVGVRRILGPCACGSLKPELSPGTFVVCDQFVDRTSGREDTFYDGPQTTHVVGRRPLLPATCAACWSRRATELEIPVVDGGTVVVIQGPRFSTQGRIALVRAARLGRGEHDPVPRGLARPRAGALLRERVAGYRLRRRAGGHAGRRAGVARRPLSRVFAENLDRLRALLFRAVPMIGPQPEDVCATALASAIVHY